MPQFYVDPKSGKTRGSSSGPETDRLINSFWSKMLGVEDDKFQKGRDERRKAVKGTRVDSQQKRADAIEKDEPEPKYDAKAKYNGRKC